MTKLTITPDVVKKRLKVAGSVASGEKVAVTVLGFGAASTDNLRLRVMAGKVAVGVFPLEDGDEWAVDGVNLACTLNLSTEQASRLCRFGAETCVILEDTATPQLYGVADLQLCPWIKLADVDVPVNLDNYKVKIGILEDEIAQIRDSVGKFGNEIAKANEILDPIRELKGVEVKTNTTNGMRQAIKAIAHALGVLSVKTLALCTLCAGGAEVTTAALGDLDLDTDPRVVTDVTFDGLATEAQVSAVRDALGQYLPLSWPTNADVAVGANNFWESNNVTVVGHDNYVTGENAVAVGAYALADGASALAVGTSDAVGNYAVAIGIDNEVRAKEAFAAGLFSKALFPYAFAVGYGAVASNNYAVAYGPFAEASGLQSTTVGGGAKSTALNSVAIGTFANATMTNALAVGLQANASGTSATAVGVNVKASGYGSFAAGFGAEATNAGSVAIGYGVHPPVPDGLFRYVAGATSYGFRSHALGGYIGEGGSDSVSIGTYAYVTDKEAVVISATSDQSASRSHGDGTITLGVANGLADVWVGTNRMDAAVESSVRAAAYAVADYIFDAETSVCYRRMMRGGYLDYVAVTNVDVRLPENYAALVALEESR